jgi:hypothetical protein
MNQHMNQRLVTAALFQCQGVMPCDPHWGQLALDLCLVMFPVQCVKMSKHNCIFN